MQNVKPETVSIAPAKPNPGWYVVIVCMLAYLFSFIDRQILSLLIGPIQKDLGISDTQFGLLSGLAFAIFYAIMGLPIATLADRKSRPVIITLGIIVWSLATVACGVVRGFTQLFVARVLVGAGEAALTPATYSLISDLFPKEKLGRAVAVYSIGSFLGAGMAFLIGGWVIGLVTHSGLTSIAGIVFKPWQLVFVIVGLPGLLLGLLVLTTIKDPRASEGKSAVEAPPFLAVLRFLYDNKGIFLPHIVGYTFAAMALYALLGWAPAYLMRTFGLSPAQSGIWLGAVALVAGGGGCLTSGWLMDWMTRKGVIAAPFWTGIIGAAGTVIPAAFLPLAHSTAEGATLLGVAMFFASFPMPPSTAVVQIAAPARLRSRVSAVFICCNSLIGLALGTLIIGMLNDQLFHSPKAVGASVAIVAASSALLSALILLAGVKPFRQFVAKLN